MNKWSYISPILTLVTVVILYFINGSASIAFPFVVFSAFKGGKVPSLASAVIAIAFMTLVYPPDYARLIAASVAILVTVWMVIELKRRARRSETVDDNVNRLKSALVKTSDLLNNWDEFSDRRRKRMVTEIEDRLASLVTLIYGWRAIGDEMRQSKRDAEKDDG